MPGTQWLLEQRSAATDLEGKREGHGSSISSTRVTARSQQRAVGSGALGVPPQVADPTPDGLPGHHQESEHEGIFLNGKICS